MYRKAEGLKSCTAPLEEQQQTTSPVTPLNVHKPYNSSDGAKLIRSPTPPRKEQTQIRSPTTPLKEPI